MWIDVNSFSNEHKSRAGIGLLLYNLEFTALGFLAFLKISLSTRLCILKLKVCGPSGVADDWSLGLTILTIEACFWENWSRKATGLGPLPLPLFSSQLLPESQEVQGLWHWEAKTCCFSVSDVSAKIELKELKNLNLIVNFGGVITFRGSML